MGEATFSSYVTTLNRYLPLFVLIRLGCFVFCGVYDIMWRYISVNDTVKLARGVAASVVLLISTSYLLDFGHVPRAVFFIDAFVISILAGGLRVGRRLVFEKTFRKVLQKNGKLTLIYGAGQNGRTLVNRFATDERLQMHVLGFIDDDPRKIGRTIAGFKVLTNRQGLRAILHAFPIKEIVITVSEMSGQVMREVVQISHDFKIKPRIMIGNADELAKKRGKVDLVRQVDLPDLLNRPQHPVSDLEKIATLLEGKRVLITGAGGSIGSEIARQVFRCKPNKLLLLDHSEFNLYQIDTELRALPLAESIVVPLLADIKERAVLEQRMLEFRPQIVLHAAAYKHVHLVESNPNAAILNNIEGTIQLLDICESIGVEVFMMISSDKAVNPAGVMGATKRVCELLVTEAGQRTSRRYSSVRFGNVLGSSGSLIPLLQKQIENGEAVTITHQDVCRYFMLIPEAVSLVLRAAALAKPGDICVLRMGEPIKIVDVAKSLILLMGRDPDEVPIVFTGLRPGEKMFEELYLTGNEHSTEHPDILILPHGDQEKETGGVASTIRDQALDLIACARGDDQNVAEKIRRLVRSEYYWPQSKSDGSSPKTHVAL